MGNGPSTYRKQTGHASRVMAKHLVTKQQWLGLQPGWSQASTGSSALWDRPLPHRLKEYGMYPSHINSYLRKVTAVPCALVSSLKWVYLIYRLEVSGANFC